VFKATACPVWADCSLAEIASLNQSLKDFCASLRLVWQNPLAGYHSAWPGKPYALRARWKTRPYAV